ncbi:uncharacterized protein PHACADRAFT_260148 [Phanerochaete carnosa HHB-10118-sp]|uniref:AB hydrolase-1 domain-containing protein n=1 Tax=Phanerochaete carnosa (strain HHB-10118-sp) TaxID=650164 RepID=K5WTB3_PHACS|nr:uncharacterized protein PHACADRAFT_260148 [Phanerochaete carnosa HHB-10118-sp]EKM53672.1 hypothetical protein PHACADRAFT_260148 [Phanerochaete carnosa HHB-10118-sp]
MDSTQYSTLTVARGFAYNVYYTSPATEGRPTLLFLHGFPSTSYDWRKQIVHFKAHGFGETSKPTNSKAFRLGALAQDVVDILDAFGLRKVIGVGHDWGSILMSRLSMLHQERFSGLVWLGLGFCEPIVRPFDLQGAMTETKAAFGYEMYAYWEFFTQPDAAQIIHQNVDSFIQLAYARDPTTWLTWMIQRGKTAECIENNVLLGRPDWISDEEYDIMRQHLLTHGVASSLLWYVNQVVNNDLEENLKIPTDAYTIKVPSLLVGASKDCFCIESFNLTQMQKYATALQTASVPAGHWPQLECGDEVNRIIEEWLANVPM